MPQINRTMSDTGLVNRLFWLAMYCCLLSRMAIAAPATPSQTQTEITHLLEFVQQSDCQFNRNDTWYNSKEARHHLEKKYRYLVKRGLFGKAEDFIAGAASQSSISGRPYQIRCKDGKNISSNRWLSEELQRYRKTSVGK